LLKFFGAYPKLVGPGVLTTYSELGAHQMDLMMVGDVVSSVAPVSFVEDNGRAGRDFHRYLDRVLSSEWPPE
jgi:hypothetical protein